MTPTTSLASDNLPPNFELLRRDGWLLGTWSGAYCVAFRGRHEGVFRWADGAWFRLDCSGD